MYIYKLSELQRDLISENARGDPKDMYRGNSTIFVSKTIHT